MLSRNLRVLPLSLLLPTIPLADAQDDICRQLPGDVCAATCVPFDAGTPAQADFSCGDFWLNERCCNGSKPQTLVTTVFYDCRCQTDGMTGSGLAVILVLVLLAFAALLSATFYVLHRKKKRVEAEEEERDKAIEEAQVYLPR